ncbi:hypothetical protein FKR81_07875 [Lentzea tibetensis]|uniref:Uncharacterized protein n=1 Tax=Lentzea tibetensis TaxID=2591470 RepID=A0A563EZF2_9PSEU|nr:hypothetical protein [Lentzea tibetensis]TWP53003.1 hypothetical protein FKR81_07875 [Lentzea tibetensis]
MDVIALDLREAVEERGYRVDVALEADSSFGSGATRSALLRDMVLDAIGSAASQVSLSFNPVNGSGRELIGERHRYRVRKAHRDASESFVVTVSTESSLGVVEEESLFPLESWVFGWVPGDDGLIADVFVAEIYGIEPGSPGRLLLGRPLLLGGGSPFGGGFTPSDEGLDLDVDDEDMGDARDDLGA